MLKKRREKKKMHKNKLLSIGFVILLVLGLTAVITPASGQPPNYNQPNQMWVEPTNAGTYHKGDSFSVEVKLNVTTVNMGGTGLMAFEYKLQWNSTLLTGTSRVKCNPATDLGWGAYFEAKDALTAGQYWHGVSGLADPATTPFMGVVTLATVNFDVEYQPYLPFETDINGTLAIADPKLGDDIPSTILPITDIFDGWYIIEAITVQPPKIKTLPAVVQGVLGVQFNVSIRIEDLHPGFDLCGWEAKLTYDTNLLDALNSYEGPFLPSTAGPNGTFYVNQINDTIGVVHSAGLFLGGHTAPSGSGVVSIIEFNATYEYTSPPLNPGDPGTYCIMNLTDVVLVNCATNPINYTITGATRYKAPYKTLGWSLDCYTSIYRKFCETTVIGTGWNESADAYAPLDQVVIYSELTYNQWPEQNKMVMFEIHSPEDDIIIYRQAITNASGIATINFTIPWPCEGAFPNKTNREAIFGKWWCLQKAQMKLGETPNDTLWFEVGWIVELLEAEVTSSPVPVACGTIEISVTLKMIMQIEKWVVLTFTVYDELLDPIGSTITGFWVPAAEWCHPETSVWTDLNITLHVPKWAHVGPGAVVYINALTDLPSNCGCPYCPEISVGFTISLPP